MAVINFKVERVKRGLTQEQLAADLGVSRGYITLIETQRETPGMEFRSKIEDYFKLPSKHLLQTIQL